MHYQPTKLLLIPLACLLFAFKSAFAVPITLIPGPTVGGTLTFSADLTGLGITQVGSLSIVDDGTPVGGAGGIFSGFDLDAIFLDADGLLATTGDRTFASNYDFLAGTTRPTSNTAWQPNGAHPGPTFGSLSATLIDLATATLDTFDAAAFADVNIADGFLTLGDGGKLIANFLPEIPITGTLFIITGEVGGQAGEGIGASVDVGEFPSQIPEPTTLALLSLGLAGLGFTRRRMKA